MGMAVSSKALVLLSNSLVWPQNKKQLIISPDRQQAQVMGQSLAPQSFKIIKGLGMEGKSVIAEEGYQQQSYNST